MVRAAVRLTVVAAACATMSLSCIWPAEYEPDAGPVAPPWIVPHQESPPFESTLQYNSSDTQPVKVTVADADLAREIEVRFCLRETADASLLLAWNPILAEPNPQPTPERKPVLVADCTIPSNCIQPCNRFGGSPTDHTTHFLYTIVAARRDFVSPQNGCDVTPGAGYAYAFWRFTCDKPE